MLACCKEVNDFLEALQFKLDTYEKTGVVESNSEGDMAGIGMLEIDRFYHHKDMVD